MAKKIILVGLILLTLTMTSGCFWWHGGYDRPHGYYNHHHYPHHYDHHNWHGHRDGRGHHR